MKTRILTITVVLLSLISITPTFAVENGEDAPGSAFVVPVITDLGNGKFGGCSGTLLAKSIVVTAGHCALDANGLVTTNIFVGLAGSNQGSVTQENKIKSVKITSTFQNGSSEKVNDDDLAFLILGEPQLVKISVMLASETQALDFKNRGAALKAIGYGYYENSGTTKITSPKAFSGVFGAVSPTNINSAYMISTDARSCMGDSGAPILNITATQVTLVGILTGSQFGANNKCGQKQYDGKYWSLFTLVGRYANLAFSAANEVMNSYETTITSQESQLTELESQLSDSIDASNEATTKLDDATATLSAFRKQLPRAIVCSSAKMKKTLVTLNSKCPAGYKVKK